MLGSHHNISLYKYYLMQEILGYEEPPYPVYIFHFIDNVYLLFMYHKSHLIIQFTI